MGHQAKKNLRYSRRSNVLQELRWCLKYEDLFWYCSWRYYFSPVFHNYHMASGFLGYLCRDCWKPRHRVCTAHNFGIFGIHTSMPSMALAMGVALPDEAQKWRKSKTRRNAFRFDYEKEEESSDWRRNDRSSQGTAIKESLESIFGSYGATLWPAHHHWASIVASYITMKGRSTRSNKILKRSDPLTEVTWRDY